MWVSMQEENNIHFCFLEWNIIKVRFILVNVVTDYQTDYRTQIVEPLHWNPLSCSSKETVPPTILFLIVSLYLLVSNVHQEKNPCSFSLFVLAFLFYHPVLPPSSNNKHKKLLSLDRTDNTNGKKRDRSPQSASYKQVLASAQQDSKHLLGVMGCCLTV